VNLLLQPFVVLDDIESVDMILFDQVAYESSMKEMAVKWKKML
jgi:hypothetical protein